MTKYETKITREACNRRKRIPYITEANINKKNDTVNTSSNSTQDQPNPTHENFKYGFVWSSGHVHKKEKLLTVC